jgi:tetratricopeptide (TPR) repeat protein
MKTNTMKTLAILLFGGLLLTGCNGLGKMSKNIDDITINLDPSPLIVRGDSVEVNLKGTIPAQYFSRKATIAWTPLLMNSDQDYEIAYETSFMQGENATGNYKVASYDNNTTFDYSDKVAYDPIQNLSNLLLMAVGTQGKKTKEFPPISVGLGVRTTPYLMQNDDVIVLAPDRYQRIVSYEEIAVINYVINKSVVRNSELKDEDMVDMFAFIKEATMNERIVPTGIGIEAFASPDGELSFNDELANERGASAQVVMEKAFKKNKIEVSDDFYNVKGLGEDWAGFKMLMQASSIADKDLIIRILEMYSDGEKREKEIKNLAATYIEIADEILPELRRSQVQLYFDFINFSDEEIAFYILENPDTLDLEQMLHAATLTEDLDAKLMIYLGTVMRFPIDFRAANNAGLVLMEMGRPEEAKEQFEIALEIERNPISLNNLAAVIRQDGDRKLAMEMFKEAASLGPEVYYNMGLIDIQNGNYASAITNFGSYNTFNVALVKMLNGDNEGAARALNGSGEKDTVMGYYLAAIIEARNHNENGVIENLAKAIELDPLVGEMATSDLEFLDYWDALKI